MSGFIDYVVRASHIYQRRFTNAELGEALKNHHLYAISRRPAVRLLEESVTIKTDSVSFAFAIRDPLTADPRSIFFALLSDDGSIVPSTFRSYLDGAYFSVRRKQGDLIHGDSWALASLLANSLPEVAAQEILYVGQAYGKAGERSAFERTKEHAKLQRIYEDHAGEAWDIFVTPMMIEQTSYNNWDHLPDDKMGFDYEEVSRLFNGHPLTGIAPKISVDLVEQGLINAIQPPYNQLLRSSAYPTAASRKLRSARLRLMIISLYSPDGLARFYSQTLMPPSRHHNFYLGMPPEPKRPVLNVLDPSIWEDEVMQIEVQARSAVAEGSEFAEAQIRWFGSEAPVIRKPPEIRFN